MPYFIRHCHWPALFLIAMILVPLSAFSATPSGQRTVNILTWWGYLDHPEIIAAAEKSCGVKISHDDYYTNDEFLRRWNEQQDNYDILIFSETIYNSISLKLPSVKSTLRDEIKDYNPIIRKHFLQKQYPDNVVYFAHAITGFLWKPSQISISANDSPSEVFKKAKGRPVILIDDPIEIKKFLEEWLGHNSKISTEKAIVLFKNLKMLTQSAVLYPTNDFVSLNEKMNPAFTYAWSGEAINTITEDKYNQYNFLIQPNISHVTSDLLAQVTANESSSCVARVLTSKPLMEKLQDKHFYFTPYLNYQHVRNKFYKQIYLQFVDALPKLPWIDMASEDDLKKLNLAWSLEKLRLRSEKN